MNILVLNQRHFSKYNDRSIDVLSLPCAVDVAQQRRFEPSRPYHKLGLGAFDTHHGGDSLRCGGDVCLVGVIRASIRSCQGRCLCNSKFGLSNDDVCENLLSGWFIDSRCGVLIGKVVCLQTALVKVDFVGRRDLNTSSYADRYHSIAENARPPQLLLVKSFRG